MEFLYDTPVNERKDYKLCFSFRIRHATDTYIRLLQQIVTLELDKKGNPWLALITNDLIPGEEVESPFRRFFINLKTSQICLTNSKPTQQL